MSAVLPDDFREAVRAQTEIVGLIGETVALHSRAGGREFVGLCCFHDDHNPSMVVYPDRQTYRCWSCNAGGDAFTFVMEREKVSFREALEILAKRAGIPVPQKVSGRTESEESNRAKLFEVLQWAENLFHRALLNDPSAQTAREYLQSRGYGEEIVREFRLGYHPPQWEWLQQQARNKYPVKLLHEARLVGERDGRYFDYFVDRVLFTIRNERGQPVAFGGRILPGSTDDRKYFNSPESAVFHKSRLLYGIDKARDAIRQQGCVLITEGYTDCITCHQYGVNHVVATLGTALTDQHVTAVKRYTKRVILSFDGDAAGQNAAAKAVERFLTQDVDLRILSLPGNLDPAEFLAAHGADALKQLIEAAPEAWEFSFRLAQRKHGLATMAGRAAVLEEMLTLLAQVPHMAENVKEGLFLANLAQRLAIPEQQVRDQLKLLRQQGPRRIRVESVEKRPVDADVHKLLRGPWSKDDTLECDLLEIIVSSPEVTLPFVRRTLSQDEEGGSLEPDEAAAVVRHPALRSLLELCLELAATGEPVSFSNLMNQLSEQPALLRLLVWLDAQARNKDLAGKLQRQGVEPVDGCPRLLRLSLDNVTFRQREQSHQQVAIQLSQQPALPSGLDPATEALLRQAAEFHKQRATLRQGS